MSENFPIICRLVLLLFLAIGLFFNSLNFMAQFIAAVICAFAFKYTENGCWLRYILLVIFACTFYYSAVLMLPCILFAAIEFTPVILVAASIVSVLIFLFSEQILTVVTQSITNGEKFIIM